MPRQRKQHQNQRPSRRKQYQATGSGEKYKPGFPMNIFQKSNWFWGVGLIAMVGGLIVGAFAFAAGNDTNQRIDTPDATSTIAATGTPEGTPDASATPQRDQFDAAGQVLVPTSSYTGTISTNKGDIELEFFVEDAPNTINSFLFLAQEGFFDGLIFHRVVEGFVAQAGDPDGIPGNGFDGPGYETADEPSEIRNERGTVSMAKRGDATTFGSQFFINLVDNTDESINSLDYDNGPSDSFYPFARVTSGMDVVDSLEEGDVIESVTFVETPDPNAPTPTATADPDATATPEDDAEATATPTE